MSILDEAWVHKDPDLYEAFASAGAAREQPLMITITTAGFDQSSFAWKLYQAGLKNKDPRFFFRWTRRRRVRRSTTAAAGVRLTRRSG